MAKANLLLRQGYNPDVFPTTYHAYKSKATLTGQQIDWNDKTTVQLCWKGIMMLRYPPRPQHYLQNYPLLHFHPPPQHSQDNAPPPPP